MTKHVNKIVPCPCGATPEFEYDDYDPELGSGDDGIGWLKCKNCGVGFHDDRESAIETWNRLMVRG